jgi:GR25 family glycosyltransferase involved in LPS biosynthesis/tetratricopeptide (TPR) repeat protein
MELIVTDIKNNVPEICLNMIVKDESHIIEDTLSKLLNKVKIDYWVISDTGSTDKTKEIIVEFFRKKNIKGELFEDKWENFGYNRTKALEHAYKKSEYVLIFDADDEICGDFVVPELKHDLYNFQFGSPSGVSYIRPQLVNNNKRWKYIGVLHEFITCIESNHTSAIITGNYYTVSGRTSNRNKDSNKYLKDALILEKAYEDALKKSDEIYNRYGFYCANSYYDCGKHEEAIKWFKITLANKNWEQEKYVSCLRLYKCYNSLNQKETGMFYLIKAFSYDKERVECLYELVLHYCLDGMNDVAYSYYNIVKSFHNDKYLKSDLVGKLFVDVGIAELYLPYYMILVSDKVGDHETTVQMYRIIFTKKFIEISKFFIGNMLYNLQFFIERVKDDKTFINLFNEYINFLISINYPIHDHEFMNLYEKYGIVLPKNEESVFSNEECMASKNILFYTGYSPIKWNDTYGSTNALGGSETAVISLTKHFPKEYKVYISGDVEEEVIDNITYINMNNLHKLIKTTPFHTIIVSRYLNFYEIYNYFSAYQTFIWGHDIALFPYGTNLSVESILQKWSSKITGCVCQTEWHKNLFISTYPQLNNKITIINNGVNNNMFMQHTRKVNNRFVYTSCTERGLDRLLELWPLITKEIPDAELFISSYNNFPTNSNEVSLKNIIDSYPNVEHMGKLNKLELYELISTAEYWLYPTNFNETSCITAMEMLISEVICLYYPIAGLVDTLGDYGIPVQRGNEIQTILDLTTKNKNEIKKRGKEYALSCSWENRCKLWCELVLQKNQSSKKCEEIFEEKNNIKVINLKRREDRKKAMIEQLNKEKITNYEIIDAVDGMELNESEELKLLFECNNFNYSKGIVGCALSHINLWNMLLNDNNNEYYVILEDDLDLLPNFKEKLNEHCKIFEEKKLEHLSLGVFDCNYLDQEKIKSDKVTIIQKDVYKFWNVAFAYIISKNAAKKIISHINKCSIKCAIDNPLSSGEVVTYHHTTCCIAKQKNINEFGSDIQNTSSLFNFNNSDTRNSLRIAYCDWWYEEYCGGYFDVNNNFIINILKKYGNVNDITVVNPNENPDVLFYSIFGNEHKKYSNVRRVFYSGEPFGIREEANYNITFDKNSDVNTRFPLWLGYLNDYLLEECNRRKNGIVSVPKREKFCSFIANGEVKTTHRRTIVEKLSTYKNVHCGGNYLNNIGYTVPRGTNCSGKIEHNNQYKFAIAFENEDYPGYVTEKICDIFKSSCIPIYWGTKEVVKDFNPNTFINANDFENFDELVEYVIKVDNDDELYARYFREPMFSNKWLDAFNDPNKTFYKNLADCIIGKNNNLYYNYGNSIDRYVNNNFTHNKNKYCLSPDYKIEYGTEDNRLNITSYISKNTNNSCYFHIPKGDEYRAALFGDPVYGKIKNIYIYDANSRFIIKSEDYVNIDIASSAIYINTNYEMKKICVMAIFKNETMNLKVWLDHYIWQGVDHFYLIDNGSTDNPYDILKDYIKKGLVTYYYRAEKHCQVEHYRYVFNNEHLKEKTTWLCICDLDEFFFGIKEKLSSALDHFENYDVIYTNSFFYGSDHLIEHPKDIRTSIIHRESDIENGTKYIFKPSSINDTSEIWIHWLVNPGTLQKKYTNEITQNNIIRLNHYRIQSYEYFTKIKMTRGDVNVNENETK